MTDREQPSSDEPTQKPRRPVPEDEIGERIKSAREGRGWTQQVLSTRTRMADPNGEGISRTVLVGYETGKTKPGAREIRLLSDALNITPNWLLLGNSVSTRALLPSLAFVNKGNELAKAIRIGLAMMLLKKHERELMGMMLFSLAGRELGDAELSGLMDSADLVTEEILAALEADFPELANGCRTPEALAQFVRNLGGGNESNAGNRLYGKEDEDDDWKGEWVYPPPHRPTSDKT